MPTMTAEVAIRVAIQGLVFIAEDPKRIEAFLNHTGIKPEQVNDMASEPEFLAGVMDYILGNEKFLVDFCSANGLDPTVPKAARAILPNDTPET